MLSNTLNELTKLEKLPNFFGPWSLPLSEMSPPNYDILLETKAYTLKTANDKEELLQAFKLRQRSFLEHQLDGEEFEFDEYDSVCDHLIIKSNETQEIVGCYRILCSLHTSKFYSQEEFALDNFLKLPGVKLELGRACIDPSHRNGSVIDLLWRGISNYAQLSNAKYLFGCSSVKTVKLTVAYGIMKYLRDGGFYEECFNIKSVGEYRMDFSGYGTENESEIKEMIPSLLRSYLMAGAKVHGMPAVDREFGCVDYLTILDLDLVTALFKRRYFKWM